MRIDFPDKSYVFIVKEEDKVIITIGARSSDNPLSVIANTVELSSEEYIKLISEIN